MPDHHLWDAIKRSVTPLDTPSPRQGQAYIPTYSVFGTLLDLHGKTVAGAHEEFRTFIDAAFYGKAKRVTVVTGKSGQIRREFPSWAALHPRVRRIVELNGGGAFEVTLL